MPNEYWLLSEMARNGKGISTELGPGGGTRGQKQQSAITVRSPQGAFATGGQAVTGRRRSKQLAANIGVDHATQTNLALQSANTHRRGRVPRRCSIESVDSPSSEKTGIDERGSRMTPIIASLESVSLEEALAYLESADGDELVAAYSLAKDRNHLENNDADPDDAEVHHALFLLRRARGLAAPSFDLMRVQLRRLVAA